MAGDNQGNGLEDRTSVAQVASVVTNQIGPLDRPLRKLPEPSADGLLRPTCRFSRYIRLPADAQPRCAAFLTIARGWVFCFFARAVRTTGLGRLGDFQNLFQRRPLLILKVVC